MTEAVYNKIPSGLLDEINKNLNIAGDVSSHTLLSFQTQVWDRFKVNKDKLPAYLRDSLPQVYTTMYQANDLIILSDRLEQNNHDLFEGYQKKRIEVFKKLNIVKSLIESDIVSQQLLSISLDRDRGILSKLSKQTYRVEPLGYLLATAILQIATAGQQPLWALLGHIVIMMIMLIRSSLAQNRFYQRLLLSLLLVPVLRVVNLVGIILVPVGSIPPVLLYYLSYGPTCVAAIVMVDILNINRREFLLNLQHPLTQILILLTGILFGFISYFFPRTDIMVNLIWTELWLPGFALFICAGFIQGFIFHGLIQNNLIKVYGGWAIVYTSILFALTFIGFLSVIHILYLFCIFLLLGWVVKITRSFIGAAFSFGIFSVLFYLIVPPLI